MAYEYREINNLARYPGVSKCMVSLVHQLNMDEIELVPERKRELQKKQARQN